MINYITYKDQHLMVENRTVTEIAAQYGTPCYIYSENTIKDNFLAYQDTFTTHPLLICFSVKANSNLHILKTLAALGSGFDIVSQGELERVLIAGGNPNKIVFSGVGKRTDELQRALEVGIYCFNVESEDELIRLNHMAQEMKLKAPVSLRVNPDIDAKTHPYISTGLSQNKFGIPIANAKALYTSHRFANIEWIGVDCHIGSQLTDLSPIEASIAILFTLIQDLEQAGIAIQHIDLGGGLGIRYKDENPPSHAAYSQLIMGCLNDFSGTVIIEPGRSIVGNSGLLVTTIEYIKRGEKNFAIIDAAMNDLLRPALYQAWQDIIAVEIKPHQSMVYDIVGPICETGDYLGKDRKLAIQSGELLAISSSGAYGYSMSSNYNTRPRVPEILINKDNVKLIRKRELITDLFNHELPL